MSTDLSINHEAKVALFDVLGEVAGALASGRRAEIVDLLEQGPRSVDEVANGIGQSVANTSHHLRILFRAGLVRCRRDGTRVYYRLANTAVEELWQALRHVADSARGDTAGLAEAYLGEPDDTVVLKRNELLARMEANEVTLLDVRPAVEYRSGHIPGALSMPLAELGDKFDEISHRRPIVAYCRGPYCAFAPVAIRALRARGMRAFRLEEGFPQWRRAGLPVAVGEVPDS